MQNDKISRLRGLAQQVQQYQLERNWSDARLCKEIAHVGSSKTYKRILDADDSLDELNVENQLKAYQAAADYVAIRRGKDRPAEPEYADFRNIVTSGEAIERALHEDSVARFIVIEGENGTGKDAVKNWVLRKWPKITAPTEANELWRESLNVPLADIINALAVRRREDNSEGFTMPHYPSRRLEIVVEELDKRKLILLINEGHHLGPRSLNLVKTLINRTPVVPVLLCIPKLLARLVSSAYEEAIQLFGNRLCERVRLESPQVDEILLMFERRGVKFCDVGVEKECAARVAAEAPAFGNWRYVNQVTREAYEAGGGKALNLDKFVKALGKARARRIANQQVRQ